MTLDMLVVWGFLIFSQIAPGNTRITPVVAQTFIICEAARTELMEKLIKKGETSIKFSICQEASIVVGPFGAPEERTLGTEVADGRHPLPR